MPNNNPGLLILYQVPFINIVPSFNFADHLMHVRQLHRSACLPLSVALIRPRMLAVHQLEARTIVAKSVFASGSLFFEAEFS